MWRENVRNQAALAVFVLVVALAVYARTLAPDITWAHDGGDGGDLITAAATGGVPHPPGYPTYLLLSWPFVNLAVGNLAWRMNLFSAVGAGGASALVALSVFRLARDAGHNPPAAWAAAAGAGLALAFSPLLWSQAVIAEVYAPGALFAALLLWQAVRRPAGQWAAAAWGLTWGMALGINLPLAIYGLLFLEFAWRQRRLWIGGGVGLACGLAIFAILPLRARLGSPVNWGGADTWAGLWWLISAQLYRGYVLSLAPSALPARLLAWAVLLVRQFTPAGPILAGWGLGRLTGLRRGLAVASVLACIGLSIFAIGYNTTDSYVHLIPVLILAAAWLGLGLCQVLELAGQALSRRWRWRRLALAAMAGALPLGLLVTGWDEADLASDRPAVVFGLSRLESAPPRAILLTGQDAQTFTLWYFHYARGSRPDVAVVDRGLLGMPWYRDAVARVDKLPGLASAADPLLALSGLGRPVCSITDVGLDCRQGNQ